MESSSASKRFNALGESKVAQSNVSTVRSTAGYVIGGVATLIGGAVAVGMVYSSLIPLASLDQLNDTRAQAGVRPMTGLAYWTGAGVAKKGVDWL